MIYFKRLFSIININKRPGFKNIVLSLLIVLILFYSGYGLNNVIYNKLDFLDTSAEKVLLYSNFLNIFLFMLLMMALLSSIIYIFGILYEDREHLFLYSLPIKKEYIFLNRYLRIFFHGASFFIILGTSVLFSINNLIQPGFRFNILGFLSILMLSVFYISISKLIVLFFVWIIGENNSRKVLTTFSVLVLSCIIVLFRYVKPEKLLNSESIEFTKYMEALKLDNISFYPVENFKNMLLSIYYPEDFSIYTNFLTVCIIGIISFILCLYAYKKTFKPSTIERFLNKKTGNKFKPSYKWNRIKILKYKDVSLFIKNFGNFQQIWLFAALILIYMLNVWFLKDISKNTSVFLLALNLSVVMFVLSAFLARIYFYSFSNNYSEIQFLKSLPVKMKDVIKGRTQLFYLPSVIFTLTLGLFTIYSYSRYDVFSLLLIIDCFVFPFYLISSAGYFSTKYIKEKFSVFSFPVQFYVLKSIFFIIFTFLLQIYSYGMFRFKRINSFNMILINIFIFGLIIIVSRLFERISVKKIINVK